MAETKTDVNIEALRKAEARADANAEALRKAEMRATEAEMRATEALTKADANATALRKAEVQVRELLKTSNGQVQVCMFACLFQVCEEMGSVHQRGAQMGRLACLVAAQPQLIPPPQQTQLLISAPQNAHRGGCGPNLL